MTPACGRLGLKRRVAMESNDRINVLISDTVLSVLSEPPADVLAEAAAEPEPVDKLVELRALCEALREAEARVELLTAALDGAKSLRETLRSAAVPDKMTECGVAAVTLEPAAPGAPRVQVEVKPDVRAGIAAGWDPERRAQGFAYLDEVGGGDLVRVTVAVSFDRGDRTSASQLASIIRERYRRDPEVKEDVNAQTLSAWLRERIRAGWLPEKLDLIGGYVGRRAVVKQLKG